MKFINSARSVLMTKNKIGKQQFRHFQRMRFRHKFQKKEIQISPTDTIEQFYRKKFIRGHKERFQKWEKGIFKQQISLEAHSANYNPLTRSLGYVRFLKTHSKQEFQKLLNICKKTNVTIELWLINTESVKNWQYALSHVSQAQCTTFIWSKMAYMHEQFSISLKKQISRINFPYLSELYLVACSIVNIEMIAFLDAPKLCQLHIYECPITSIKPFGKTRFNKLKFLEINLDYVPVQARDFSPLSRASFSHEAFDINVTFDIYREFLQVFQLTDFRFLMKLAHFKHQEKVGFIKRIVLSNLAAIDQRIQLQAYKVLSFNDMLQSKGRQQRFTLFDMQEQHLTEVILSKLLKKLNNWKLKISKT